MPKQQGRKRKYQVKAESQFNNTGTGRIPKGQPCILVSCDPSRETKCQREVLEILRHDWEEAVLIGTSPEKKEGEQSLTLEQELANLKQAPASQEHCPFLAFETGCKGALLLVCTKCKPIVSLPQRLCRKNMVDDVTSADTSKRTKVLEKDPTDESKMLTPSEATDTKVETPAYRTALVEKLDHSHPTQTWDPIESVKRITAEMAKPKSTYPDSRFCTKLTPFQTLIFADMDKIENVVQQLISQHIGKTASDDGDTTTFAIRIHRRLGSLSREGIISKVGEIVKKTAPKWTVHLKQPDVIVWIEIIKNLAGISLLTCPVQNLTAAREQRSKASYSTMQ